MTLLQNRVLSAFLVLALGLSLGACGGSSDSAATATATGSSFSSSANSSTSSSSSSSTSAGSTNRAPSISGTATTSATVGASYSFTPTATDPDGNVLAFSISNKPAWATFNTSTGALAGTPNAAGTFSNIVITVSDGTATAALASFAINVTATGSATLSWVAPTQNTDGSALTDLAGYTIYYGTSSSSLSSTVSVNSPSTTTHTIPTLVTGRTYYFAIASVNNAGISSDLSSVASKTI